MFARHWLLPLALAAGGSGCTQPSSSEELLLSTPAAMEHQATAIPEAPRLVGELAPGTADLNPSLLTPVGQTVFFSVPRPDNNRFPEIWKTDGTEAGTVRVKAIESYCLRPIASLTRVEQTPFFITCGQTPTELWKSDGTEAGTVRVKAINPDSFVQPSSYQVAAAGNMLFLIAYTRTSEQELWRSDGTEAGTVRLRAVSSASQLTGVGSTLFFVSRDDSAGSELWKSDGTEAGTVRVKDIRAGTNSALPSGLTSAAGLLYFAADDGASGSELWRSDGTEAGTFRVKDISPGSRGSNPQELRFADGRLYFTADDGTSGRELWTSDGTAAGTVRVRDILPGTASPAPQGLTAVGGRLYFTADDGTSGRELWTSDGTEAGTVRVRDIRPGTASPALQLLTAVGGTLYFTADDGISGRELWTSQGTEASTQLVRDIRPGAPGSLPRELVPLGTKLLFSASDGQSGFELWATDGTAPGTALVTDAIRQPADSSPEDVILSNGAIFFSAQADLVGRELVKVPRFGAQPELVMDTRAGLADGRPGWLTDVDGTLFFIAASDLWKSDGTPAGTQLVKDLFIPDNEDRFPRATAALGDTLFLVARGSGASGDELWKSDGTPAGTQLVKDIYPGGTGAYPSELTPLGGLLYFSAEDGTHGRELWRSDGTAEGTWLVKDIRSGTAGSNPGELKDLSGALVFTARNNEGQYELWRSDGTEAGTTPLLGGTGDYLVGLEPMGGAIYFSRYRPGPGLTAELWKSDGTAAGTVRIRGGFEGVPLNLRAMGDAVYFTLRTGVGQALWRSDGTEAGTVRVADIATPHNIRQMVELDGLLFFYTEEDALWRSDGTQAGTVRIPGVQMRWRTAATPVLTPVDKALYFPGDDGTTGSEPWVYPLAPIRCPAPVTLAATDAGGVAQAFWPPARPAPGVTSPPTVSYSPGLGQRLPVGTTWVIATAVDPAYPASSCTFPVTVTPLPPGSQNHPPVARCRAVTVPVDAVCTPIAADVNDGSYDPDPGDTVSCVQAPSGTYGVGTHTVTLTCTDRGGLSASCQAAVTVQDTFAPALELVGSEPLVLGCGDAPYTGVVATDACAGDLTSQVEALGLDLSVPGTYQVSYRVADASGNVAEAGPRTVQVLEGGEPSIALNGDAVMTLECGVDTYVDPGARAWDGCGRPLEVHRYNSGQDDYGPGPNTGAKGTYSVQYIAWNSAGHTVSALRTVHVDDRTPPVLTLRGPARMTHTCGSGWVDPGVEATDACYGNVAPTVVTTGYVNGWVAGTYTVRYEVRDSGGNAAPALERIVEVTGCP